MEAGQPSEAGSVRCSGQVVAREKRIEIRIGLERARAGVGVYQARIGDGISAGIEANRVVGGVHDARDVSLSVRIVSS